MKLLCSKLCQHSLPRPTGIFRSVVTKSNENLAHARILEGILNGESRACVGFSSPFCDNRPENPCKLLPLKVVFG